MGREATLCRAQSRPAWTPSLRTQNQEYKLLERLTELQGVLRLTSRDVCLSAGWPLHTRRTRQARKELMRSEEVHCTETAAWAAQQAEAVFPSGHRWPTEWTAFHVGGLQSLRIF